MRLAIVALLLSAAVPPAASARSLEQIQASGTLSVCLPANSLPFSSRHDTPAGFQVSWRACSRSSSACPCKRIG